MKTSVARGSKMLFAGILLASVSSAYSAVYMVGPDSGLDVSGTFALDISGLLDLSGSGALVGQPAGGLHTSLAGTVLANSLAGTLTFPGGSAITAPDGFSFIVTIPLSGASGSGTATIQGTFQNLAFDLTGATPLSGPPSNEFNTQGLELVTLSGSAAGTAEICVQPFGCFSSPVSIPDTQPESDVLPAGTGQLTQSGLTETLFLPVALTFADTVMESGEGVNVTATFSLQVTGNIDAARVVPEPSSWALLLIGVSGIAVARRWRKSRSACPA